MKLPPRQPYYNPQPSNIKKSPYTKSTQPPACINPNTENNARKDHDINHARRVRSIDQHKVDSPRHTDPLEEKMRLLRAREKAFEVGLRARRVPDYDPLLDEFLQDHFSSPTIRKHLRHLGIINKNGMITDNRTFKYKQLELDRQQRRTKHLREKYRKEIDREVEVSIRDAQSDLSKNAPKKLKNKLGETSAMLNQSYNATVPNMQGAVKKREKSRSHMTSLRSTTSNMHHNGVTSIKEISQDGDEPEHAPVSCASKSTLKSSVSTRTPSMRKKRMFLEKSLQTSASLIADFAMAVRASKKKATAVKAASKKKPLMMDSNVGTSQSLLFSELKLVPAALEKLQNDLSQLKSFLEKKKYKAVLSLNNTLLAEIQKYSLKEIETSKLRHILAEAYFTTAKAYFHLKSWENCESATSWALRYSENEPKLYQATVRLKQKLVVEHGTTKDPSLDWNHAEKLLFECIQKLGVEYLTELLPQLPKPSETHPSLDIPPNSSNQSIIKSSATIKRASRNLETSKNSATSPGASYSRSKLRNERDSMSKMRLNASYPLQRKGVKTLLTSSLNSSPNENKHSKENEKPGLTSTSEHPASKQSQNLVASKTPTKNQEEKGNTPSPPLHASPYEMASTSVTADTASTSINNRMSIPEPLAKHSSASLLRLAMFKFLPLSTSSLTSADSLNTSDKAKQKSKEEFLKSVRPTSDALSVKSLGMDETLPLPNSNFTLHQANDKKGKGPSPKRFFANFLQSKPGYNPLSDKIQENAYEDKREDDTSEEVPLRMSKNGSQVRQEPCIDKHDSITHTTPITT